MADTSGSVDPTLTSRHATVDDLPPLLALIDRSVRGLNAGRYTPAQIDSGLRYVFGPDTQLIADRTYFVIEGDAGTLVAAGGWSQRRTLYGGDQTKRAPDAQLDPRIDAARIRAFFVDPAWARRGLARRLYTRCERDAIAAGYRTFELGATLPGIPLYEALGFAPIERADTTMPDGEVLPIMHMRRSIG